MVHDEVDFRLRVVTVDGVVFVVLAQLGHEVLVRAAVPDDGLVVKGGQDSERLSNKGTDSAAK